MAMDYLKRQKILASGKGVYLPMIPGPKAGEGLGNTLGAAIGEGSNPLKALYDTLAPKTAQAQETGMPDPQAMLEALLRSQAGTGAPVGQRPTQTVTAPQMNPPPEVPGDVPRPPIQQTPEEEQGEGPQPSDEELLETVHNSMGQRTGGAGGNGGGAPPPMSGMKWVDVDADREALLANPDPDNVDAFVEYWGEDELPPELQRYDPSQEMDAVHRFYTGKD